MNAKILSAEEEREFNITQMQKMARMSRGETLDIYILKSYNKEISDYE